MYTDSGFLSINEPCHEGWQNMSISEKGRFCSSCRKEVRDFSNSSLDEIKRAYAGNNGELCGHVPTRLLQEEHFAKHLQQNHFGFLKKFFIAAVFCFGACLFTIDSARASTFYKLKLSFLNIASDTIFVKGEVHDHKTHEAIPFVNVVALYHDSVIVTGTTDIDGKYSLRIPKEYSKVDVKALYPGYDAKVMKAISIAPGKQIVVDFELEANAEYITDGIMIYEPPLIKQDPGGKSAKKEKHKKTPK